MKIDFIQIGIMHDSVEYLVNLDRRDNTKLAYKGKSSIVEYPGNHDKQNTLLSGVMPEDVLEYLIGMQIPNLELIETIIKEM
jgi:hypothetical protein